MQTDSIASAFSVCITDVLHFVSVQAFFVKDYIMNHPEDGEKIGRLRELMFEQVRHVLIFCSKNANLALH